MKTTVSMRKELELFAYKQLAEIRKVNQKNLSGRDLDYQTMLWDIVHRIENF